MTPAILTELTFKVFSYLPGTFLLGVYHDNDELAATVVSQRDWLDEKIRKDIMDRIGKYLVETYIKPSKDTTNMRTEVFECPVANNNHKDGGPRK